jgi:hypothetical protein
MGSSEMINFVCWKWRPPDPNPYKQFNSYESKHVNVLYSMLKRNMQNSFRLICLTDDSKGIRKEVEILPVWDDFAELGGCYRRLKLFKPEMKELIGEWIVSIDLDCVILSDITSLFKFNHDFRILEAFNPPKRKKTLFCGSLYMLKAGSHPEVWESFDPSMVILRPKLSHRYHGFKGFGTDQLVIAAILPWAKTWSRKDGIQVYREFLKHPLPKNTRIVFFNGRFDPSHEELQERHPWIRKAWRE